MQPGIEAERAGWQGRLQQAGALALMTLGPAVEAADPEGRVLPRSRLLCAALGELGVLAFRALGGGAGEREADVRLAAAALSLLTKVDDEVIDRRPFHGGMATDRRAVRARTEAFLAPTLASLGTGLAASAEPRCAFAADVGRRLARLAGCRSRLMHVLEVIAEGWRVQVDAVATLSSHPGELSLAEVAGVTRRISGAWLLMIALVGSLPAESARPFTADEEEAVYDWGLHIQRADALADLQKDLEDGLISSYAGRLLWEREPARHLAACRGGDAAALYAMAARHRVDEACLRGGEDPAALAARLQGLGEVGDLLAWIHGFLIHRYLTHPLCRRDPADPAFLAFHERRAAWTAPERAPARRRIQRASSPPPPRVDELRHAHHAAPAEARTGT